MSVSGQRGPALEPAEVHEAETDFRRRARGWAGWVAAALDHLPLDDSLLRVGRGRRRHRLDRQLAWTLAFVAGAINAGGFLAVGVYTSHVTGSLSRAADEFVLGHERQALGALAMVLFFLAGAFTTGFLLQVGLRWNLRSRHAISLALEAVLLMIFGLAGSRLALHRELFLPATVVLLCFLMGMHNAVVTHISNAVVRTTHMTGIVTDIGIELARWVVGHGRAPLTSSASEALRGRLSLHSLILVSFFAGGLVGAIGFSRIGYSVSIAFAFLLVLLALRPIAVDFRLRRRHARMQRGRRGG
jgi:uncharacterized membrane protein YoaK (UPF0700 family)